MLCTLVMTDNIDAKGVARYPVGTMPVHGPGPAKRWSTNSAAAPSRPRWPIGPTIGKNIALAYLPWSYCQEGRKLEVEYFGETYPVEVAGVGYKPLYDPENLKPRS